MNILKTSVLTALLLIIGTALHAQQTIYGIRTNGRFLQSKVKYVMNEGDSIRFDNMRYYVLHTDGTQERGLYTTADTFFLSDPGVGLYRPNYLRNNDFSNPSSQYSFARSKQSDHFVVFWEPGFGDDPTQAPSPYTFDPDDLLSRAELAYSVYTGQLGFSQPGNSPTLDTYKIIMLVHYQTEWRATGSGVDNRCGTLDVNPAAARTSITTAHEIGHTFQYIVSCDYGLDHGWRYGFGPNASGGCAWWESCAQWQAFKVYPDQQFTDSWSNFIYRYSHLNLLHEEMRYYNFFVQDYWCQLYGPDFIGRLWIESTRPEDPVETYQRINHLSQAEFCRDMFDYACRAITWDIDAVRDLARRRTDQFETSLHNAGDGWWEVDSANCPQNYGFNIIRLRVPEDGATVKAAFRGEAGAPGYRAINVDKAGWRYGFVAQTDDGSRVYGDMYADADGTAEFRVPDHCAKLWFVVSGAPTEHWHHPWDMTTDANGNDAHTAASLSNDEQWPYLVRFSGTNLPGEYYYPSDYERQDITLTTTIELDKTHATTSNLQAAVEVSMERICDAIGLPTAVLSELRATSEPANLRLRALNADGSESNNRLVSSMFYWGFNADGNVVTGSIASTDYVLTLAYSNGNISLTGVRNRLEAGRSYQAAIAFVYTNDDGQEYTARILVNVNVK